MFFSVLVDNSTVFIYIYIGSASTFYVFQV